MAEIKELQKSQEAVGKRLEGLKGAMLGGSMPIPKAEKLFTVPVPAKIQNQIIEPGNIDVMNRPRVVNPEGSVSSVRSMSVNIDGREVLIPTVSEDGRIMSATEAIHTYNTTGKHLGIFKTEEAANAYAQALHEQQAGLMGR